MRHIVDCLASFRHNSSIGRFKNKSISNQTPIKLLGMLCDGFSVQKHWPQVISIWNHRNYNYVLGLPIKLRHWIGLAIGSSWQERRISGGGTNHDENFSCPPKFCMMNQLCSIIIAPKKRISASRAQQKRIISTHKFMLESCDKSDESHHTQLVPVQAIELENFLSPFLLLPNKR